MKVNIAFFHIGTNTWQAEMLCRSAKAIFYDENVRTIQLSNNETPKTKSADLILRSSEFRRENIMYSRMIAYKECLKSLAEPTIFLDTDILIVRKFFIDTSNGPVLCKREYNFDKKLPPFALAQGNTKIQFKEQGGMSVGQMYPYIGCFFADKEPSFLEYALEIYKNLDPNYHFWYGDQIALREAAKTFKTCSLPESQIASNPLNFALDKNDIKALHFKGAGLKSAMNKFYLEIFMKKATNLKCSFRSNPKKAGFEIPNSLNPYFKDFLAGASSTETEFIDPTFLDIGLRSDILCKVMFLLSIKLNLLPKNVGIFTYNKSMSSLNGFMGSDSPCKTSPSDYYNCLLDLFDGLKKTGSYDSTKSSVPINCGYVPIDGSHRVGVAIALEIDIPVVKLPVKWIPEIPLSDLTSRFGFNLLEKLFAIRTYLRYKKEVQLLVLFPARNVSKDEVVISLIRKYFRVEEIMKVPIVSMNQANKLVQNLYPDSEWLGSRANNFEGLNWKSRNVYIDGGHALFLICAPEVVNQLNNSLSIAKDIKEIARSIYEIGFHSIHSANNIDEKLLIWDNFILNEICGQKFRLNNYSSQVRLDLLTNEQKMFIDILASKSLSIRERTVISGGLALALLGIRATKDIDLITDVDYDFKVDIHNSFVEKYGECNDFYDYIRDPMRTFWLMHQGKAVRIISLVELHKIKAQRLVSIDSEKDSSDLSLIKNFLK